MVVVGLAKPAGGNVGERKGAGALPKLLGFAERAPELPKKHPRAPQQARLCGGGLRAGGEALRRAAVNRVAVLRPPLVEQGHADRDGRGDVVPDGGRGGHRPAVAVERKRRRCGYCRSAGAAEAGRGERCAGGGRVQTGQEHVVERFAGEWAAVVRWCAACGAPPGGGGGGHQQGAT